MRLERVVVGDVIKARIKVFSTLEQSTLTD
jgi:hypothetical protein